MNGWLRTVLLAAALLVATWALMVLLARRLPPGLLRDLARFVPDCVTTIRRLRRDPRVPRRAKVVVALAGLWLLSPIDLLPEFLPVIGPRLASPYSPQVADMWLFVVAIGHTLVSPQADTNPRLRPWNLTGGRHGRTALPAGNRRRRPSG